MRRLASLATPRSILLSTVLLAGLAACGSGDDSGASSPEPASSADEGTPDGTDGSSAGDAASEPTGGPGTATLTMSDGMIYEFEMGTCETSNTDDFLIPDSYDLSGRTADGSFRFSLGRAGLGEDFIVHVGYFEGDFDDEGKNSALLYNAALDDEPLTVDGANVSGTLLMNAIGPTQPHGDQVEAVLDARC